MRKRDDWRAASACSKLSIELVHRLFDLSVGGSPAGAKALCAQCPVKRECGNHAILYKERGSIWGGMTQIERDSIESLVRPKLIERARILGMLEDHVQFDLPVQVPSLVDLDEVLFQYSQSEEPSFDDLNQIEQQME